MKRFHFFLVCLVLSLISTAQGQTSENKLQVEKSKNEEYFPFVKAKALEVMRTGFNAGDGYREVWIRD
jgi:ABC-type microcin C transport system permease subunit YejE